MSVDDQHLGWTFPSAGVRIRLPSQLKVPPVYIGTYVVATSSVETPLKAKIAQRLLGKLAEFHKQLTGQG